AMGVRRSRSALGARIGATTAVVGVVIACYAPTQIVLRFRTNLQNRSPQTSITVGSEPAFKQGADADGRIGELVVVPSGAHDAVIDVKVALGVDGLDANVCAANPKNALCVTASRQFRFATHETR